LADFSKIGIKRAWSGQNPRASQSTVIASAPIERKNAWGSFSVYGPSIFAGAKLNLHLTEHPNGLPASCRLSSVNPEKPAASFIRDTSDLGTKTVSQIFQDTGRPAQRILEFGKRFSFRMPHKSPSGAWHR
jgi:hypothetical protein